MMIDQKFTFSHPVQGMIRSRGLTGQSDSFCPCRSFDIGTGTELIVSLSGLAPGKWELALEWEYE